MKLNVNLKIVSLATFYTVVVFFFFSFNIVQAGTLSCAVRSGSCNTGEVNVFKLNSTSNSHTGLPGSSSYTQLVCCGGVTGLGTNCSGTYATVIKLSSADNAHLEIPGGGGNYTQSACLSVPSGGAVSIGYQTSNCTGFDTTVASMSSPSTNAHGGDGTIYTNKICATASGAGSVSSDIVDSSGTIVASPSISFSPANFWWSSQQPTGTFGISSQKIRVTNTRSTPGWTLSIAAADNSSLWTNGINTYDFNDTASIGRMQVDPSVATITPQSGCTTNSLTKGSATYFVQGLQDSISLIVAGSSAQTNCYWDITGIAMTQSIPASQPTGNYALNMVVTVL